MANNQNLVKKTSADNDTVTNNNSNAVETQTEKTPAENTVTKITRRGANPGEDWCF